MRPDHRPLRETPILGLHPGPRSGQCEGRDSDCIALEAARVSRAGAGVPWWRGSGRLLVFASTTRANMGMSHPRLGPCCLLIVLVLTACGHPATATPTQIGSPGAAGPSSTPRHAPTATAEPVSGPALTPTSPTVEEMLLQKIAERICPSPQKPDEIDPYERYFNTGDRVAIFTCYPAAGHSITVTIRPFADPRKAQAGFEAARAPGSVEEVDGFPTSDWQEHHPSFPGGRFEYRVRLLRAGAWLIEVRSFDDTHFLIAPDPREASEAILQVVREYGLQPILDEDP